MCSCPSANGQMVFSNFYLTLFLLLIGIRNFISIFFYGIMVGMLDYSR